MNRLDYATEIIELAQNLGVGGVTPVENILNYCQCKIDGWVSSVDGVANIVELEALVTRNLQMVFEEINSDEDWERLKDVYARGMKEFVFGGIRKEFEDDNHLTYGALVQLEATLAHKKEVKRKLQTRSLFNDAPPPGELRAVKVIANRAATRERFNIPTNMQVPASSVIRKLFDSEMQTVHSEEEDLQHWESRGKSLDGCPVIVEGRRISDRVVAIVQPIESRVQVLSKDSVQ